MGASCFSIPGSVLQIVSAPGQQYLRPQGPVVMQTVSQAGNVQNALNAMGNQHPASLPTSAVTQQGKATFPRVCLPLCVWVRRSARGSGLWCSWRSKEASFDRDAYNFYSECVKVYSSCMFQAEQGAQVWPPGTLLQCSSPASFTEDTLRYFSCSCCLNAEKQALPFNFVHRKGDILTVLGFPLPHLYK